MHATVSHLTNVSRVVARMYTPELLDDPIDYICLDSVSEVTVLNSHYIESITTCTSPLFLPEMHATVSHLTNVSRVVAHMHTLELLNETID